MWRGTPREWWNSPSKWWKRYTPYLKKYVLPYLKTKKYITVDDPFMCVKIDRQEKGSNITLNDILFATRALALDDTRTYEKFTVISAKEDTLMLKPEMDNWST